MLKPIYVRSEWKMNDRYMPSTYIVKFRREKLLVNQDTQDC